VQNQEGLGNQKAQQSVDTAKVRAEENQELSRTLSVPFS
jgi:hypothetical protein